MWNVVPHMERTEPMRDGKYINSLSRGLAVLECFNSHQRSYSHAELSKSTGIAKSTLFRLLKTLCAHRYLKFDPAGKRYSLGPRVLSLGFSALQSMEIREIARPYLEDLARECRKTVNLAVLDRHEIVYIERIRFPDLRDLNISIGSRQPVYLTAAGRAILAYLESKELKMVLVELEKNPQASKWIGPGGIHLLRLLEEVRRNGFAINNAEMYEDYRAIGVPIFSQEGTNHAINLVVSHYTSVSKMKNLYAPILIKVGHEISEALGHRVFQEGEKYHKSTLRR